ncbi:NADH dehydrogenase [Kribbella sp. VKM Ac-2569]|uniref:SDR family oxidoreductase n=1 Tax=Kribbella sp. VKM Ac-2569 TaxID=2512220 RepID=UPI00102B7CC3|nr:NAD(P)H-binding protein [Kribbella sp. VKM Ac-2569]RZT20061.1 NADH dehydrogenase [Kribbella sp. VKM Ac-2569]
MILVVGGTGELGGRVVRLLLERDLGVRCLVRPASDATGLESAGAEVVRGDLTDAASLRAACDEADTVVSTATAIARRLSGARRPTIHETDKLGTAALVDAAEEAGVRRFVYVSYAGISSMLGTPLEHAKLAIEDKLGQSAMRSVIVRPDAFQEIHLAPLGRFDVAKGKISLIGSGDAKVRWVSTDDVAALLAAVAVEPDPPAMIEVGGPEELSRKEAVVVAEDLTRRQMKVQRMPAPVARLAIRLLKRRNDALASVFGAGLLQSGPDATWTDEPLRSRGITPRSATDYLRDQVNHLPR